MEEEFEEREVYEICVRIDSFIADRLTESIMHGTSYDALEAKYGVLPISRRGFYRKRRAAKSVLEKKRNSMKKDNSGNI